ncbi:ABC transporter ATP-binding protein [Neopusillimonas maritima]|jgi:branched-chain amino acid transport system ATP-binding protein|uniref:ABC transporter ATP-binding protein n=1 Tax=Neopusillimonas maritima TaxID=2026239 RepID=A0ABX9MV87_9BURK|nr:ABC transporter ATP-binding protein [Neopusillimonas maritima]MAL01789.1 ABC transporter ATP-binding protein [Alcaligenaceae bacterium]RII82758.1 ABC transporter ATP-binding protein [Neopusillimonas maritima]|tara:strand:- start:185895 stop:186599 length:705 start_codon:yes stop_codon:yes gene_type:complete
MLEVKNLSCGYGAFEAVHGISLSLQPGTITGLLGANGAGKSSTLMCLAGHVTLNSGQILFNQEDISRLPPYERVRKGLAISPEGRRLFKDLSVEDNLRVGGLTQPKDKFTKDRDYVLSLFPRLGERLHSLAGNLSGGEQQMLAIGRALMAQPKVILIDELSLGLMPKVIDLCYQALEALKNKGLAILLVEQNTDRVLNIADDICVLESGRTVWQGTAKAAAQDPDLVSAYLGMH